jgi:hypothetical protein
LGGVIQRKDRSDVYKIRSKEDLDVHLQVFLELFSKMWRSFVCSLLSASVAAAVESTAASNNTYLHCHDSSFTPDFHLSVTYQNHTVACQHRMSVLINGTSPGPTLRLPPGKTSWVRVCNDMDTYNTTMVLQPSELVVMLMLTRYSTGMASPSAPHLSAMVHLSPNGPLRRTNASTTRFIPSPTTPGHTSITLTSVSRL